MFALGIMPYITASIIMQLLTVVIPKLEELAKEGEQGQKQITKYTRWLTVALSLVQSFGYIVLFRQYNALPDLNWWRAALIVSSLVAGAVIVMWLGELITARGIGNGMSIMIFISIVSRIPAGAIAAVHHAQPADHHPVHGHRARVWSSASSGSRAASGAFRCSTPSGWSDAA